MIEQTEHATLLDRVDEHAVFAAADEAAFDRNTLVRLDPDHPGFRDREYRARRDRIAAHEEHACAEYLACVERLGLPRDRIPQLREVTEKVEALCGFRLEPVAGLVAPRVFLESLANGVFLSTQYIRHHSTPLYTPEPDVAHEIIGHAVTLASERLAELNRLVGEAVRRSSSTEALGRLSRLYWFTLEFGVLREGGELKAYGTGLLSSAGELEAMHKAELLPLDLDAASWQEYEPTAYQPRLFCADSFEAMYEALRDYLRRWQWN
jgi:phenylalanine-4-hydroxylase